MYACRFSSPFSILTQGGIVQSHVQHYAEPSSDPEPASTSTLSSTLLPLGPGTLTHNASGVPVIVVCSKADLIDEGNEVVAGGMVKGKGGEWEERTDGIMQVLRTICLKCVSSSLRLKPILNVDL
jgi:dynein light intermediate chain 1, cytosolic